MNEPHRGYIEVPSMYAWDYNTDLHLGPVRKRFLFFLLSIPHSLTLYSVNSVPNQLIRPRCWSPNHRSVLLSFLPNAYQENLHRHSQPQRS